MKKTWMLLLSLVGCHAPSPLERIRESTHYAPQAYHFYVLGDWGEEGDCRQRETAHAMQAATHHIKPDIIISTGDNFYPQGVSSSQDPRWKTAYEYVYDGVGLQVPWYAVLGNHDHQGNIQAQIRYTQHSPRWNMPSAYYTRTATTPDGARIRFVYLDTSPFEKAYYHNPKYRDNPYNSIAAQDTTRQKMWMDSVLADKTADWKIVVGHHLLYSGGKRKQGSQLTRMRQALEPLLEKHRVAAYFSGHEHNLQHIYTGRMHYFVSGAGSYVHRAGKMKYSQFTASIQGFMIGSVTKQRLLVQVLNYRGERLYHTEITKP